MFDVDLVLEGALVRLEPLREAHVAPLFELARGDPQAYRHTSTPVTDAQRDFYYGKAFRDRDDGRALPFAVVTLADEALVGSTRFTDLEAEHRVCEVGYTWYRTDLFGQGVNVDCKYLMFRHAFEELGLHRLQLHTDENNERSQRAIKALGAKYEGTLRRHKIRKDGSVRNTVVFSVTDQDWPEVRGILVGRLRRHGVEPHFEQRSAAGEVSGSRAGSPPGPPDPG